MKKTVKEIREFFKGHYYCNDEGEENVLWEPFENWDEKDVDKQIENDTESLCKFMGVPYKVK